MNEYIILHAPYNKDQGDLIKSILINIKEIDYFYPSQLYADVLTFIKFLPGNTPAIYVKESSAEIEALIMGSTLNSNEFKYSHFALPSITANEDPIDYLSDKVNRLIYELEKLEKENAKLKQELDALMNDLAYPDLNSHVGRCIFSPIKAKRVCAACASKLEIGDNSAQTNSTIQQATEECLKAQEYNELLNNEIKVLDKEITQLKEKNATLKDALSDTQKQLEIMVKYSKDKFHSGEHSNEENAKLKEQLETLKQRSEKWVGDINGLQFKNASLTASLNTSNPANPCCRETYEKLTESLFTVSREDRLDLINWNESFRAAIQENKNVSNNS